MLDQKKRGRERWKRDWVLREKLLDGADFANTSHEGPPTSYYSNKELPVDADPSSVPTIFHPKLQLGLGQGTLILDLLMGNF